MTSFFEKMKLAGISAGTVAKNIATGAKVKVTPEQAEARLSICKTCPSLKTLLNQPQCGECGCLLTLKSQLEGMTCKLGKWPQSTS